MKSRRRREWFRRSSAMFMALALIISGLSLPEGLFSITAKAAEKASAEWTVSSTMYADGDNEGRQVAGQSYARLRRGWRNDGRTYEISQGILER